MSCFKKGKDHVEVTEDSGDIAGVSWSAIDAIPELSLDDLNKPLTTGAMLKIIAGAMRPLHEKIADLDRRIHKIEEKQRETTEIVNNIESTSRIAEKKHAGTESKMKTLEEKNEKLKKAVMKHQSQIASQEKNVRLRNVVIGGLDETEPLSVNGHTASSDDEKVELILSTLNMSNIYFAPCR